MPIGVGVAHPSWFSFTFTDTRGEKPAADIIQLTDAMQSMET